MTDNEMRVAIAEACGIECCHRCLNEIDTLTCHCGDTIASHGCGTTHDPVPMGCTCGYDDQSSVSKNTLPDYCNDMNAMHEAECWLTVEEIGRFIAALGLLVPRGTYGNWDALWWLIHAKARQRAEAFLKTVGGWKE